MNLTCDRCGPLEYALIDGYAVGDRLLEGVLFEIRPVHESDTLFTVVPTPDAERYMKSSHLKMKDWCEEIARYVVETDVAACPTCQEDVDLHPTIVLPMNRKS